MPFIVTLEILGFILLLLMYIYLAYKQVFKPYLHAIYITALYWCISLGAGVLMDVFLGIIFVPLAFVFPVLLNVIAVLLGTLLGIQLRQKRGFRANGI
ncbi:hypothetical protein SG35_022835 [Thalassomonas actiniarum]|uniref:Uncharacterized protein n=2 Tax=Thalassomonas actiniarum TaxID=485447 RepID=A0AAE9YVF6_9GAMM|nr:hypothetical protein SG35_022835 [Thalassomonas actiniarum]